MSIESYDVGSPALTAPVTTERVLSFTVFVAALGYFVDMYDLSLFGVVRVPSLKALGITDPTALMTVGMKLINCQMVGMLAGGVLWGILGDKRGRLSVLFGSILLYSLANIANAFVTSVAMYEWLRLLAGVGLAGELGAAITLVSEVMPKEARGYGTTIVATLGLCGSAAAALVGDTFAWKTAYLVGGGMGLLLLALRFNLFESGIFEELGQEKGRPVRRGDIRLFFSGGRLPRYLCCILIGVPIWFVTGVLVTFAPDFARHLGVTGPISAGRAILAVSIGLAAGDLASGLLSQWLASRRGAILVFLGGTFALATAYLTMHGLSPGQFYALCGGLGVFAGYWAVFVTVASEQFGTNLRATVTTTVPNFVRGSLVVINTVFSWLILRHSSVHSAMLVGGVCFGLGFLALWRLPETFGRDLAFTEE